MEVACEGTAVLLERHGHDDGNVRIQFTDGDQRGTSLLNVHHRFDGETIDAAFQQAADLFLIDIDGFLKGHGVVVEWLDETSRGGDVAEDEGLGHGGFRDFRQTAVHGDSVFFKPVIGEFDGIGAECTGIDDVRACGFVVFLDGRDGIRMLDDPCLRADAMGHAELCEFRTRRAVEEGDLRSDEI